MSLVLGRKNAAKAKQMVAAAEAVGAPLALSSLSLKPCAKKLEVLLQKAF